MYGEGTFDDGLSQAREIGKTTAQAKFAEDMYMQRLKDAQDAALAASEAEEAETKYQEETGQSTDKLIQQFKNEKVWNIKLKHTCRFTAGLPKARRHLSLGLTTAIIRWVTRCT